MLQDAERLAGRYGLTIRAAVAGDADGVAALLETVGLAVERRGLAVRLDEIPSQSGLVLVAEEWGPLSGLVALRWSWSLPEEHKAADLHALVVDPAQRRRGVARILLKAAARAARGAGCAELRLLVPPSAEGLDPFCRATGFVHAGAVLRRPLRKRDAAD